VPDRKIGDNKCQIVKLKCIKFDFRWGSPRLLAVWESTSKEREEREGK